jgi:hypothetical protein
MNLFRLLLLIILSCAFFSNNAQTITSAASGNWGDGATWVGGVPPDTAKNVVIAATHTVTVNVESNCNNITFNASTSKLIMNANLNCYGNFIRFDTSANHFTSWTAGAKFRFTGYAATQSVTNLNTISTTPYPFRINEIVIDKGAGKFITSAAGGNYKFGIGTSLEVVKGTFEIASTDDIEGRDIAGSASTPTIIVRAGALFNMVGSSSYIRRGNFTGDDSEKLGKMTIYGEVYLASSTTSRLSFTNIDIESGGILYIPTGRGWAVNCFNPGTLTVKNGGTFRNGVTTNIWYANPTTPTIMDLQDGGIFVTYSGTTPFPPNITNNGTVKYAASTFDQTITDVNYSRLELSYTGGFNKNWTLAGSRVISDSLETNNSAILVLSAASAQNLTVNGTLRLTSGSVNNSNPNVTLTLGSGAEISKATGTISNAPTFSGTINLKYSSSSLVTAGLEMPSGAGVLNNLSVTGTGGIVLASSPTVNGSLSLSGGKITLGSNNLTAAGSVSGAGSANYVVTDGTGGLIRNVDASDVSFPVGYTDSYTPVVLNNSGTADNFSVSVKNSFDNAPYTNEVVTKQWTITENTPGGSAATVKLQWNSADENPLFVRTNPVFVGRYTGSVWEEKSASYADLGGGVYTALAGDFTEFSPFTVGNMPALPVELSLFTAYINGRDVCLNWSTKTEKNSNKFEIERLENLSWINIGSVKASVLSNSPKHYSYIDKNLQTGKYQYRIKMVDNDGSFKYSKIVEAQVSLPRSFNLSQNYPNPFNPETNIRFDIPKASNVNISIYNITGQKVVTLLNEYMEPGFYQRSFSSHINDVNISSGTYFYILKAGDINIVKKMILMK